MYWKDKLIKKLTQYHLGYHGGWKYHAFQTAELKTTTQDPENSGCRCAEQTVLAAQCQLKPHQRLEDKEKYEREMNECRDLLGQCPVIAQQLKSSSLKFKDSDKEDCMGLLVKVNHS